MRISDKIACCILLELEDKYNIKIKKKDYLDVECLIGDMIQDNILKWLKYDFDLEQVRE